MANIPARFQDFAVTASDAVASEHRRSHRDARDRTGHAARRRIRSRELWKKFATPGFGAGRNVRFGDLDGDGKLDMLIAQNIPRVRGDAFDHI